MNVTTSSGILEIPQYFPSMQLSGRQSKVVVTDYQFGSSILHHSTASVLFAGRIGERDVLFLHGHPGQAHEASLFIKARPAAQLPDHPLIIFASDEHAKAPLGITILPGVDGLITILDTPQQLVLYSDTDTAGTFWAPTLAGTGDFANFWQHGTNDTFLMGGPHLVRSAKLEEDGAHLAIQGDLKDDVRLFLFAPPSVRTLSWNGILIVPDLVASSATTAFGGGFVARLTPRTTEHLASIEVPELKDWKYADSLPEVQPNFSDENWTVADHKHTNIPYKPHYGDGTALYGCDYGL
jgi:hypothetical protein